MASPQLSGVFLLALLCGMFLSSDAACLPGTFTANPDKCNEYYLCIATGATTTNHHLKCKDGLNFDPSKGVCTANYKCLICD